MWLLIQQAPKNMNANALWHECVRIVSLFDMVQFSLKWYSTLQKMTHHIKNSQMSFNLLPLTTNIVAILLFDRSELPSVTHEHETHKGCTVPHARPGVSEETSRGRNAA